MTSGYYLVNYVSVFPRHIDALDSKITKAFYRKCFFDRSMSRTTDAHGVKNTTEVCANKRLIDEKETRFYYIYCQASIVIHLCYYIWWVNFLIGHIIKQNNWIHLAGRCITLYLLAKQKWRKRVPAHNRPSAKCTELLIRSVLNFPILVYSFVGRLFQTNNINMNVCGRGLSFLTGSPYLVLLGEQNRTRWTRNTKSHERLFFSFIVSIFLSHFYISMCSLLGLSRESIF